MAAERAPSREHACIDILITLYHDDARPRATSSSRAGPTLRKPIGPEHGGDNAWVTARFGTGWASEVQVALANRPVTAWLAVNGPELLGFACYDATALSFFGPIGVDASFRGQGIGAALLRTCLHDMRSAGYGYAITGAVGVPEFCVRVAGASEIPDSAPDRYADRLAPLP